MIYNIKDYYYHTISKDSVDGIYEIFEKILKDGQLKSQALLGVNEIKFNGNTYISLASFTSNNEYKSFIIDEDNFIKSGLSDIFDNYNSYLEYMRLDSELEKPMTKEEFFVKSKTSDKKEYFSYLDSISRTYPVDILWLYNRTRDKVYKYIMEMTNNDILYCYKSDNCFDEYVRKTKGISFVFPKPIEVEKVNIIPNIPTDIEIKLAEKIQNTRTRYSNQIGEVQVKDVLDINKAIGIIISDEIDINKIKNLIGKSKYEFIIFKLKDEKLVDLSNK